MIRDWVRAHPTRSASLAGWFQQLAGMFGAFVSIPFVLKYLPPDQAGLWFTFQGFLAAVGWTDFGFSFVTSRQVAYSVARTSSQLPEANDFIHTRPGWAGINEVYQASRVLYLRTLPIGFAVLVALHELVMPRTRLAGMNSAGLTVSWYLLGIAALLALQSRLNQSVLDGLGLMYITKGVSGTLLILNGLGTIAALHWFRTLWAASVAVLIVAALQLLVFRTILFRHAKGKLRPTGSPPDKEVLRKLWKVAVPIGIVGSSAYCVSSIQVPLLGAILGPAAVVPYYLAQRIGQTVGMCVAQLSQPQLPKFTSECARGDWRVAGRRMQDTISAVMAAACAGCLVYFVASPSLVSVWTHSGPYVSPPVLGLMSLEYALLSSAAIWGQFLLAAGSNPFMWSTLMNGGFNLAGSLFLCYNFGTVGLPLAGLISGSCTNYWYAPYRGLQLRHRLARAGSEVHATKGTSPNAG